MRVEILFSLKPNEQKLWKLSPRPVKVGFLYTPVENLLSERFTRQSKNANCPLFSGSEVNSIFECLLFKYDRNKLQCDSMLK